MKTCTIATISTSSGVFTVTFSDGTVVTLPLSCFPRLAHATPQQRAKARLIGGGIGVHWPLIDADISVENILRAYSRLAQQHGSLARLHTTSSHAFMIGESHTDYVVKHRRQRRPKSQLVNRKS